ncbi:MAG: hypothetical protein E7456_03920 [Ruminococcaceae bacterium]|nr:hypothetical protein [Oscillospiraceae bacterium]
MNTCCVCKQIIYNSDPPVLFVGKDDADKCLCDRCNSMASALLKPETEKAEKDAITFFKMYSPKISDNEVKAYFTEIMNTKSYVEELNELIDDDADSVYEESSWGSFLRLIIGFNIALSIVASIIVAFRLGDWFDSGIIGFIIACVGIVLSLASNALMMTFLDLAKDIRSIKIILKNKKNKK